MACPPTWKDKPAAAQKFHFRKPVFAAPKRQNAPARENRTNALGEVSVVIDWLPVFSSRRLGRKKAQSR
jgi:hypothetical protein